MNYEIPENEVENVLSVYWLMLMDLESKVNPKKDAYHRQIVEAGHKVLRRAGICDTKARWED